MTLSKPADSLGRARNPGTALRLDWLGVLDIDPVAVERRGASLVEGLPTSPAAEVDLLLQVVKLLDLTTLSEEDTDDDVRRLCARAVQPIHRSLLDSLSRPDVSVAAVCVFDRFVPVARDALAGSNVRVAAVTAGFPHPHAALPTRLQAIRAAAAAGADEVDVVISREHVLSGDWPALYDEVTAFRGTCGEARLKTILAAGDLGPLQAVAAASLVCCMAGADFVKSSTGREQVNATLPIGLAMAAGVALYARRAAHAVGLKPAGGIRSASEALSWLAMAREELGPAWTKPGRFRIGASSLLANVERRLQELVARSPGAD